MSNYFVSKMVSLHPLLSFACMLFSFFLILPRATSCLEAPNATSCTKNSTFRCLNVEREALLTFKESLIDPSGRLTTWVDDDCCNWIGVGCENNIGHVIKLDLRNSIPQFDEYYFDDEYEEAFRAYENSCLKGKISSSLLNLKHLSYLDLSFNNFSGSNIPKFLGSLKSLKYLNLSSSYFSQDIPSELGNLSRLEYLDLNSFSYYINSPQLGVKSIQWLVGFPSLKYLNLGGVILGKVQNLFEVIIMLPSLLEVHLPRSGLSSFPPSIFLANMTSLSVLDLSNNYFNSLIPHWLSNVSELSTINLENCFLRGVIPDGLGHLPNLRSLNFVYNNLIGKIPSSFANLCKLQTLDLAYNSISGKITEFVDGMSQCSNNISGLEYGHLNFNRQPGGNLPYLLRGLNALETIDLSGNLLKGSIPNSIRNLSSLQILHLSFIESSIPNSIGNLLSLKELSLSFTKVLISNSIGNLSSLQLLSLSFDEGSIPNSIGNLLSLKELFLFSTKVLIPNSIGNLLSLNKLFLSFTKVLIPNSIGNLSSLQFLSLSFDEGSIPNSIGNLLSLKELSLSSTKVLIPNSIGNLSSLQSLHLFSDEGSIPNSIGNLLSLKELFISFTKGLIPNFIGNLSSLQSLHLSSDKGSIPNSIGNLSLLQSLDLDFSQMKGTISQSIGKLSKLVSLNLYGNSIEGVISEPHFQNLTQLKTLELGARFSTKQPLVLDTKHDWVPPFKLVSIQLNSMQVGPKFPMWLKTQTELQFLYLINVGIYDIFPYSLWKSCSNMREWDLSYNNLQGLVPHLQFPPSMYYFDLSFNNFEGTLPIFPSNLTELWLHNNMFSTPIPENINELLPKLQYLDLSSNRIMGRIPHSIGMLKELGGLILRNNTLFGELPSQWKDLQNLRVLDLANNNLSGNLPWSMWYLNQLRVLSLHQNHFHGKIPSFFINYKYLIHLDLGGNKFFGKLPTWIGESLSSLSRLNLRANLFYGEIPQQLCLLSRLQILDIAHNEFSGAIPPCIGNLSDYTDNFNGSSEQMELVWRGRKDVYFNLIDLYSIDLSANNLSGEIPKNITSLFKLVNLNLSRNHLIGRIPEKIGNLRKLESLDLSNNELFGHIPESLSYLNFLSHLNLSFNNLSGRIPQGYQLQTLDDSSIYQGNPLLCGPPLSINCSKNEIKPKVVAISKNGIELSSIYVGMIVGFIFGFWGVCGTLIVTTSWRQAYFGCFENIKDKIIVFFMVKVVCLLRKFKEDKNVTHG